MNDIRAKLNNAWDRKFGELFRADKIDTKTLSSPEGKVLCRVIHSSKLEKWYESPAGKARYEKPKCFFCEEHDEYAFLENVLQFGHLGIYLNIKSVAPCHFLISPGSEHRENVSETDITALHDLAGRTGLSIFGNFRDSGASYPQHVHYQSLGIRFLVSEIADEEILSDDSIRLARIDYPVAAFRLYPNGREGLKLAGAIVHKVPHPYNLLFYGRDIFIVPRVKSIPFNTNGFKFAAAEVCGCVFTRTREMYNSMNYDLMLAALQDVCIPAEDKEARDFEGKLLETAKEVIP